MEDQQSPCSVGELSIMSLILHHVTSVKFNNIICISSLMYLVLEEVSTPRYVQTHDFIGVIKVKSSLFKPFPIPSYFVRQQMLVRIL